jgi:hypothetical protein
VVALLDHVEEHEVGVGLLRSAAGRLVGLPREDADGGRDGDALDVEEPSVFSQWRRPTRLRHYAPFDPGSAPCRGSISYRDAPIA